MCLCLLGSNSVLSSNDLFVPLVSVGCRHWCTGVGEAAAVAATRAKCDHRHASDVFSPAFIEMLTARRNSMIATVGVGFAYTVLFVSQLQCVFVACSRVCIYIVCCAYACLPVCLPVLRSPWPRYLCLCLHGLLSHLISFLLTHGSEPPDSPDARSNRMNSQSPSSSHSYH